MKAHEDDPHARRFEPHAFREREGAPACSYCGSLDVETATRLLTTPGTRYSGADWKYGWPHKFYLEGPFGHRKFYSVHLRDAAPEQLEAFNRAAARTVGITFVNDPERGLGYHAPRAGFQTWGVVEL